MGNKKWRPRHGAKLPTGWKSPGTIERLMRSAVQRIPKRLLHPVWGILVATALAISGRSELVIHSYGLLAASIWLIVDLWAWLLGKQSMWCWRFVIGGGCSGLLLIGVMVVMWWWMDGKLDDQRNDVFQHLAFSYVKGNDPMDTIFVVTNNSSYEISRKHELMCFTRRAVAKLGGEYNPFSPNMVIEGMQTFWRGGKMLLAPGVGLPPPFSVGPHGTAASTIKPGGDASSEPCLAWWRFLSGTNCADVTIGFWYTLQNQPDYDQEKDVRYFVHREKDGTYTWIQEPVEDKLTNYCDLPRHSAPR